MCPNNLSLLPANQLPASGWCLDGIDGEGELKGSPYRSISFSINVGRGADGGT